VDENGRRYHVVNLTSRRYKKRESQIYCSKLIKWNDKWKMIKLIKWSVYHCTHTHGEGRTWRNKLWPRIGHFRRARGDNTDAFTQRRNTLNNCCKLRGCTVAVNSHNESGGSQYRTNARNWYEIRMYTAGERVEK